MSELSKLIDTRVSRNSIELGRIMELVGLGPFSTLKCENTSCEEKELQRWLTVQHKNGFWVESSPDDGVDRVLIKRSNMQPPGFGNTFPIQLSSPLSRYE